MAQRKQIRLGTMRWRVQSLASISGLSVAMSCGVGCRRSSDPALLWLWCRPAATALVGPLAWESPYATGGSLKNQKNAPPNFCLIQFLSRIGPASRAHSHVWLVAPNCAAHMESISSRKLVGSCIGLCPGDNQALRRFLNRRRIMGLSFRPMP